MIEVFKTNVKRKKDAKTIIILLKRCFPKVQANFDLEDCDKILRIEAADIDELKIISLLESEGFDCGILEDIKESNY